MSRWFSHYMEMLRLFNLILQTPRLEQPAGDRGERLFRAEDKIGPGRDIWKALPSLTHTIVVDEINHPWHAKDPGHLGSHEKRCHCVCVCRYTLKGAVCIGMQWKERRIGTLWKVAVFIRLRWWREYQACVWSPSWLGLGLQPGTAKAFLGSCSSVSFELPSCWIITAAFIFSAYSSVLRVLSSERWISNSSYLNNKIACLSVFFKMTSMTVSKRIHICFHFFATSVVKVWWSLGK